MFTIKRLCFKNKSLSNFLRELIYLYKLVKINCLILQGGLQNKIGPQLSFLIILFKLIFSDGEVFVCATNNQIIGGLISFRGFFVKSKYFIDSLAVKKLNHGKGIGTTLIAEFEKYLSCKNQGNFSIFLKTFKFNNSKTISFYMKNGFKLNNIYLNNRFILFSKDI